MIRFKGAIATSKVGSDCEFEFEMADDSSAADIEDAARDAAFECVDWWFEPVEKADEES